MHTERLCYLQETARLLPHARLKIADGARRNACSFCKVGLAHLPLFSCGLHAFVDAFHACDCSTGLIHDGEGFTLTNVKTTGAAMTPLDRAIEIAGSVAALAAAINVATSAPSMWKKRGNVPAEHCPAIERETGVCCEDLRPDIPWNVVRGQSGPAPLDALPTTQE